MVDNFIAEVNKHIRENTFVKITLGDYKGTEPQLKQIIVKPVLLKKVYSLSFVYRYKTKDITKNYAVADGVNLITGFLNNIENGFGVANLFTATSVIRIQYNKNKWRRDEESSTKNSIPTLSHDKEKHRKIASVGKSYLEALGLTDAKGDVYKSAQDKYRQINHYIELLSPVLKQLPRLQKALQVVDMGAGKGYLTFALADYLKNDLNLAANVLGVEYRQDMVQLCNSIALSSALDNLSFEQNTIEDYNPKNGIDVLIALHACDTATDDAIAKGINNNAEMIVVAPCCHKQIRRSIKKGKAVNQVGFLTKHGIFMERQAEMITDGMRALILEYFGYQVKVFSFIDEANTPKNVMITALKQKINPLRQQEIGKELQQIKLDFGIEYHHLERLVF